MLLAAVLACEAGWQARATELETGVVSELSLGVDALADLGVTTEAAVGTLVQAAIEQWQSDIAAAQVATSAAAAPFPINGGEGFNTHPTNTPRLKPYHRSEDEIRAEEKADRRLYEKLHAAGILDVDANRVPPPSASTPPSDQSSDPRTSVPGRDAETVSFLERASATLASVMQHDGPTLFHYKQLLRRAKAALRSQQWDRSATLFREASKLYFHKLRAPYESVASVKALGETFERRIEAQLAAEREGNPNALTPAQQFRDKELQNKHAVHTAFMQYHKELNSNKKKTNKQNKKPVKHAGSSTPAAAASVAPPKP